MLILNKEGRKFFSIITLFYTLDISFKACLLPLLTDKISSYFKGSTADLGMIITLAAKPNLLDDYKFFHSSSEIPACIKIRLSKFLLISP